MDEKIQWHPGFYAGMELELRSFELTFDSEHQLTRGPLSIDLLIIKKLNDQKIDVDFAEIFRRHNIVEFKSPEDELSIDVFYKTQAYACLYKASGETVNAIPAKEITVSLFRDAYPREMIDQLKKQGFIITERHPGIYQISGAGYFITQLIVTSRLESDQHAVLRILSNHAKQEDVEQFIRTTREYVNRGDTARADSVLQVSVSANMELYRKLRKEDAEMCAALKEIMKEDFDEAEARGEARGEIKGENRLAALISKLFSLNRLDDAQRCSSDIEYREKLYKEFKLA